MVTSILAETTAEAPVNLPMSPAAFGIVGIVVFAALLVATLAFRNAGHRR